MNRPLAILFVLLLAVPATAQPLTLSDALVRVETEHPDLGRLRAALAVNRGQRLLGYGIDAPTVSYAREGIDGGGFAEQRVVFSQGVASPVATYYGLRRIDTEADALRLDADARRSLLRVGVEKAFVDVMYAERLIALRAEALDLAQQFLEAARLRESMGEAAGLETMRAEIALAEAEAALVEAERTREQARVTVAAVAALDADVEVVTPGPLTFHSVDVTRDDVFGRLSALPEWQSAATSVDAAGLGVRESKGALFPGFAVEVFPQDFGDGFNSVGFQVGLRIPIPGTPSYRGPKAVAQARLREREWVREATTVQIAAEAEAAWTGYVAAREAVVRYRETIGPRADTLVARSHEGYLLGEVPLFALLDAQRTALAAEERYAAALRDYTLRLAELERFVDRPLVFPDLDRLAHHPSTSQP
jgi:cobalt-zinc-cadmium efflux system outer membrane protein